jgi:hypothetical protein
MQLDMQVVLPCSSALAERLLFWSMLLVSASVQQQGLGSAIKVCTGVHSAALAVAAVVSP